MKWTSSLRFLFPLGLAACGSSTLPDTSPAEPAAPAVPPELPDVRAIDADGNRLDDRTDRALVRLREEVRSRDPLDRARAEAELGETIRVECIFSSPVGPDRLAQFEAMGGAIQHVFRAVSYGWIGTLPRGRCDEAARALGPDLLVLQGDREVVQFMDEATRVGR